MKKNNLKKKMKFIWIIIFLIGISVLLYPFISQYWNTKIQTRAIANYEKIVSQKENINFDDIFTKANNYNQKLFALEFPLIQYKQISESPILNINNNRMIGYITIDKINIKIPIYQGTSTEVLNIGVGHLDGSSLPVGGNNTHSVLLAHSGLPSAKLFTNLNKLEIGDTFIITILGKELTYQVDKIIIVDPNDVSELEIIEGKDYVTLITCTPYGINTYRLLVRGTRIDMISIEELNVVSDAEIIDRLIVTLIISISILTILLIYIMIKPSKK